RRATCRFAHSQERGSSRARRYRRKRSGSAALMGMFPSLMLRAGARKKGKRAKINIGDATPKRSRNRSGSHHAANGVGRVGIDQRVAPSGLGEDGRRVMHCSNPEGIVFAQLQSAELGLAEPRRICQYGLEHRLQFTRRAADNLQHVGGGGLLLQRFAQLVEQPGVLDCDDGLIGEALHQINLLVGVTSFDHLVSDSEQTWREAKTECPGVLRLITNSNLLDCMTGRSAGFSPFKIRPVYTPAWRYASVMFVP